MTRKNTTPSLLFCAVFLRTVFFLAPVGASAAGESGWRIYSEAGNGDVHFYDASRVETSADLRTVWTRIRYKRNVMAAASYQSLLEIDCSGRTERTLQRTFFSDRDWQQPAMKTDTKPKKKRRIRAGSVFERLAEIVCSP